MTPLIRIAIAASTAGIALGIAYIVNLRQERHMLRELVKELDRLLKEKSQFLELHKEAIKEILQNSKQ